MFAREEHASSTRNVVVSLAQQYGIKPQGPAAENGLKWIEKLIRKIDTTTSDLKATATILRRKLTFAYYQKFGVEIKLFTKSHPIRQTIYKE